MFSCERQNFNQNNKIMYYAQNIFENQGKVLYYFMKNDEISSCF